MKGRKLTSWPTLRTDIRNAGGNWVDQEVVVDQGLVTSRKPDDIPAFNAKMIEEFAEGKHAGQREKAQAASYGARGRRVGFAEHRDPIRAAVLGGVHRRVRLPDEILLELLGVDRMGDSEARGDRHLPAAQVERRPEGVREPPRELRHVVGIGDRVHQDEELVAAVARDHVGGTDRRAKPAGDGTKEVVARIVAERVVDLLEVVEVDEDDAQPETEQCHLAARVAQPRVEVLAVREERERIVLRPVDEIGFVPLARVDVLDHDRDVLGLAGTVPHECEHGPAPERRSVGPVHLELELAAFLAARGDRADARLGRLVGAFPDVHPDAARRGRSRAPARPRHWPRAPRRRGRRSISPKRCRVEDRAVLAARVAARHFFGRFAVGDVDHDPLPVARSGRLVGDDRGPARSPRRRGRRGRSCGTRRRGRSRVARAWVSASRHRSRSSG